VLPFSLIVAGQTYIPRRAGLDPQRHPRPLFTVIVMAAAGERKIACAADRGP